MITWEEVKKAKPKLIFYSASTCWWTHDEKDLQPGPVPLDIFGSPLFQTGNVKAFLDEEAIKNHAAYGKDPLKTLMACHHQNIEWLRKLPGFHSGMSFRDVAKLLEEAGEVK